MRIIRRKDFLNEAESNLDRNSLVDQIQSGLSGLSDSDLEKVYTLVNSLRSGFGNSRIKEEFGKIREMDWSEMDSRSRKAWLLSLNPDLSSSVRGNSFLNMIVHNDWKTAQKNIANFLESQSTRYVKRISENEEKKIGRDEPKTPFNEPFWVKPKTRKDLMDAIMKEISNVSLDGLNSIYSIIVQQPGSDRDETRIDQLLASMESLGQEWETMGEYLRKEFLVNNSPYPFTGKGWLNKFYDDVSEMPLKQAMFRVSKMQDYLSDFG